MQILHQFGQLRFACGHRRGIQLDRQHGHVGPLSGFQLHIDGFNQRLKK